MLQFSSSLKVVVRVFGHGHCVELKSLSNLLWFSFGGLFQAVLAQQQVLSQLANEAGHAAVSQAQVRDIVVGPRFIHCMRRRDALH